MKTQAQRDHEQRTKERIEKRVTERLVDVIWLGIFVGLLLLCFACFKGCSAEAQGSPLPATLDALCRRIEASESQPDWKRALVPYIRGRKGLTRFEATATCYLPNSPIDPQGGGKWSSTGLLLRWGHCAVDPRVIPYGSLLVVDGIDQLLIVVDCGSAINGNDIDICCPSEKLYRRMARSYSYTLADAWIVGRLPMAQVRRMR